MTLEEKSAAAIAHSGVLSRKRPYKHVEEGKSKLVDEAVEVYQIRRLLFVDFVEHVCLEAKSKSSASKQHSECTEPNGYLKMCKLLGQLLVDRFGGDGLTSHSAWFSWEQERELIAQYIEVVKMLDAHPIAFDFLLMLSDLGIQGICFMLPLVKAFLVSTIVHLENTSLKSEKISMANLERSTQILSLLISADFFPDLLMIFHKILSNSNNHEAFVLMRDLWEFLRSNIPSQTEIEQLHIVAVDQTVLIKKEGSQLISSMVFVIQRNISSLGNLLPSLLVIINEKDEDDWTIEREPKPISVLAEIKR